jgi:ABC-type Zn uptake system ZnuABC Zn-binding protein ZnuA
MVGKRMEKRSNIFLIYVAIIMVTLPCFALSVGGDNNDINIMCTNSILADFTSNLLTENVTIDYIMPAGVCPAQFDTTPSDVNKIVSADVVISIGSPTLEGWLGGLLPYNSNCKVIECTYLGEWNIPSGARRYVEKIQNELSVVLPQYNEIIQINAKNYLDRINETAEQLKNMIINNNIVDTKVICMEWQKAFVEWLGLNVTFSYGPRPSTQDALQAVEVASREDVYLVIDNLQSGTEFGSHIASDTGKSQVIFTNFPNAIPGTDTYLDMITYNTRQILEGIESYQHKQGRIVDLENHLSSLETQRNIFLVIAAILGVLVVLLMILYKKK